MHRRLHLLWTESLAVRPAPGAHRVGLRAGLSVAVPLLAVLALGHPAWSAYAAFGAFASLYGRTTTALARLVMQLEAGLALVLVVVAGAAVSALPGRPWYAVAGVTLVAGLGALLSAARGWHPPGPLFLVFAFGAVASVPRPASQVPVALAVCAASAASAVLVGTTAPWTPRARPLPWRPVPLSPAVPYAGAALASGLLVTAWGVGHPYWATVAAVAPLTGPTVTARLVRGLHRVLGTLAGLVLAAALLAPGLGPYATVAVVGVLQVVTETLVGRHYGLALLAITPMALLMGQVAAPRPAGGLLWDRGVETVVGALVALLVILVEWRYARRRAGAGAGRTLPLGVS
ncbi:fusaric acid resistance family protein [Motilibacter rhizosphaerae]|uniref:Fusaric acid resistance family protein n=1 Tax=Motilibacter rhizosphaerae TaxID=598652 RepID=A0A4Q7NRL4_9ACTN|nr:FUSC family protein [Motilibacter rhizosphaerae]RZS89691.1 fusaric acid resistance family protein [Motilibacter rhizosphaerae]